MRNRLFGFARWMSSTFAYPLTYISAEGMGEANTTPTNQPTRIIKLKLMQARLLENVYLIFLFMFTWHEHDAADDDDADAAQVNSNRNVRRNSASVGRSPLFGVSALLNRSLQ